MKKIIMAAAIVCAAACAQATTVTWGMTAGNALDATKFSAGTAYLINVAEIARPSGITSDALATEWYAANKGNLASAALDTGVIANGTFTSPATTYELVPSQRINYWLLFVNEAGTALAYSTTTKGITLSTSTMSSSAQWGTSSMKTYGIAAATPEPTSALLLLIGMAGLALRRRRA